MLAVNTSAQRIGQTTARLHQRAHAEVDVAAGALLFPRYLDLTHQLRHRPVVLARSTLDAAREVARPHMPVVRVLADPPFQQHWITLPLTIDRPVELGREVIDPAFVQPEARVCIDFLIRIKASDLLRKARPPDAEWADTHLHVTLLRFDLLIHRLDETVHVVAPPIVDVAGLAFSHGTSVGSAVRKLDQVAVLVALAVRVEVVIDVHAIEVVASHHVQHDIQAVPSRFGQARIEPEVCAILDDKLRTANAHVIVRNLGARR